MTKTTHTIPDVEGLILEKLDKLRDSNDRVEQRKLRQEILRLEKHHKDCNEKAINGHKYPDRMKGFPDDKPMNKKALLELIDSVEVDDSEYKLRQAISESKYSGISPIESVGLNLAGEYVTDPTDKDYDKGWKTPKTMNPTPFFK